MANICEVKLRFKDSTSDDDLMMVRDKNLLSHIDRLVEAIKLKNPDWLTTPLIIHDPLPIPFNRAAVEFLFQHVRKYGAPQDDSTLDKNYPETKEKDMDFLKELIDLASFMECIPFQKAMGFVIAKRMNNAEMEKVADFFAVAPTPDQHNFDRQDVWNSVNP